MSEFLCGDGILYESQILVARVHSPNVGYAHDRLELVCLLCNQINTGSAQTNNDWVYKCPVIPTDEGQRKRRWRERVSRTVNTHDICTELRWSRINYVEIYGIFSGWFGSSGALRSLSKGVQCSPPRPEAIIQNKPKKIDKK